MTDYNVLENLRFYLKQFHFDYDINEGGIAINDIACELIDNPANNQLITLKDNQCPISLVMTPSSKNNIGFTLKAIDKSKVLNGKKEIKFSIHSPQAGYIKSTLNSHSHSHSH